MESFKRSNQLRKNAQPAEQMANHGLCKPSTVYKVLVPISKKCLEKPQCNDKTSVSHMVVLKEVPNHSNFVKKNKTNLSCQRESNDSSMFSILVPVNVPEADEENLVGEEIESCSVPPSEGADSDDSIIVPDIIEPMPDCSIKEESVVVIDQECKGLFNIKSEPTSVDSETDCEVIPGNIRSISPVDNYRNSEDAEDLSCDFILPELDYITNRECPEIEQNISVSVQDYRESAQVIDHNYSKRKLFIIHKPNNMKKLSNNRNSNESQKESQKIEKFCSICQTLFEDPKNTKPPKCNKCATFVKNMKKSKPSCEFCDKTFSCQSDLNEHIQTHTSKTECVNCKEIFSSDVELKIHYLTHIKAKSLRCDDCNKLFSSIHYLKKHMHLRGAKCDKCGKVFSYADLFELEKIPKKPLACEYCGVGKNSKTALRNHIRINHTPSKCHLCEICGKRFVNQMNLEEHSLTHSGEKKFECEFCKKRFSRIISLKIHLKYHTGETPYECKTCGKGFVVKSCLTKHMQLHTEKKKFVCDICGKTFNSKVGLTDHAAKHKSLKMFKCQHCEKYFSSNSALHKHTKLHTNEKLHECVFCSKRFSTPQGLKAHIIIHTGERPYPCETCGKQFSQSTLLRNHLRIHTGERPFKCKFCSTTFAHSATLYRHMRVHKNELQKDK